MTLCECLGNTNSGKIIFQPLSPVLHEVISYSYFCLAPLAPQCAVARIRMHDDWDVGVKGPWLGVVKNPFVYMHRGRETESIVVIIIIILSRGRRNPCLLVIFSSVRNRDGLALSLHIPLFLTSNLDRSRVASSFIIMRRPLSVKLSFYIFFLFLPHRSSTL